jgi:AcrR family transcriptional regulator
MTETETKQSTRARLIEAAGCLFAEKGFKDTTVKDITERAGANVAAVNYYFRDKEKLYEEVILHIFEYIRQNFPIDKNLDAAASPESRFESIVRNLLYRFISPDRPAWQGILLAQERMNPNPTTLLVIHDEISKTRHLLRSSIKELLGPDEKDEEIELCEQSVIGQILHQAHIRSPQAPTLIRRDGASNEEIDLLARHIAEFSLGGIRRICKRSEENRSAM